MTKIQWVKNPDGTQGKTWNPIVGCTKKSKGCHNCYALAMAWRLMHSDKPAVRAAYQGVAEKRRGNLSNKIHWTGRVNLLRERLGQPLQWKKPRRIFIPSMGDLFHKNVPSDFIDSVLQVIHDTPQHTYQLLTKRPERMKQEIDRFLARSWLPNLWLGVSAENQATADERIPLLLQTPAVVRFVSCEPLLEEIDLSRWLGEERRVDCGGCKATPVRGQPYCPGQHEAGGIDQCIVGCETGPGARPMELDWARSLRDQCQQADVAFFYKQGPDPMSFQLKKATLTNVLDRREWTQMPG